MVRRMSGVSKTDNSKNKGKCGEMTIKLVQAKSRTLCGR
jgi:hypothetical protein